MGFFHEYPYTDMHELNLDWVLKQITQLDLDIKGIEERATKKAIEESKAYIDAEIVSIESRFTALSNEVAQMRNYFDSKVSELQTQYNDFIQYVNAQLTLMNNRIIALKEEIDAEIIGVNARTDLAIQQNNEYIFDVIEQGITTELKVINFFTGERISIQDMFNYLSLLHVDDGATLDDIADADKTVNEIITIDASCTDWVLHGKSLIA